MNRLIILLTFFICALSCKAQISDSTGLKVGAERFELYLPLLDSQRVGLVVNQTSIIKNTHLVDKLLSLDVNIKKVFAAEHGFRGDAEAGEKVIDGVDTKTNLPIISLYGSNKKPKKEQLEDIDVLIFDIQDVGTRFFTYISTMHYIMEAAAENDKTVIILDRPNPNGMYIDGPVLKAEFTSFVGMHPIPIIHGLTVGELALMINGEGWLTDQLKCKLAVISCENYSHNQAYSLPVKPSPNLPNDLSVKLYPSLCLFEGTVISVGRGTYQPFQQIGHPSFRGMPYSFTPQSIDGMSKHPKHENKECYGYNFTTGKVNQEFTLEYLIKYYEMYQGEDSFFNDYFNKLAGNATLQKQVESGLNEEQIKASWEGELNQYKAMRKKYLLYTDFE